MNVKESCNEWMARCGLEKTMQLYLLLPMNTATGSDLACRVMIHDVAWIVQWGSQVRRCDTFRNNVSFLVFLNLIFKIFYSHYEVGGVI